MLVVPQQYPPGRAQEAFDDQSALRDARAAQGVLDALTTVAQALRQS